MEWLLYKIIKGYLHSPVKRYENEFNSSLHETQATSCYARGHAYHLALVHRCLDVKLILVAKAVKI